MGLVRVYEMPAGWDRNYDEGHLRFLYPNDTARHPTPESVEQFLYRLAMTRRHYRPGRGQWNWDTWHWEHEWEEPEETLERIFQEHRLPAESPGTFTERFFSEGAAHNDADDHAFLRRIAWDAETFADSTLRLATAKLDLPFEEAQYWNRPRSLRLPYASAFRNSLRLSGDKQNIMVDLDALERWTRKHLWKRPWDITRLGERRRDLLATVREA